MAVINNHMSRKVFFAVGATSLSAVFFFATVTGAFAEEMMATRPGQVRKEVRQEIKEDRKELRQDVKTLKKMVGTRQALVKATLTAKGGDTAPTTLTVTKDGKTFTINVTANTQFRRRFGGKGSLMDLQINDIIDVTGKWADEAQTTIEAKVVRDESVQRRLAVFVGKVKTVSGSTIVIETVARGSQTITVGTTTKIISRKETPLLLADIKEGHVIRVKGLWNNQLNTVSDVSNIKDYSLPIIVRPAPKATSSAENR